MPVKQVRPKPNRVGHETIAIRYPGPNWSTWLCRAGAASGMLLVAWIVFAPALNGQFVFDDLSLPIYGPLRQAPLSLWISGVRPVLMLSYWVNLRLFGDAPFGYHFVNLIIHCVNSALVFLVISRILSFAGWSGSRRVSYAFFGSLLFLVHPLQTESVSYIAGRSESLASLFLLLAYVCFLERWRYGLSWGFAIVVVVLFALGVGTKENAVSFAGILILTDVFWPQPFTAQGALRNRRLYALLAPAALGAAVIILRMLATAPTAGFSVATSRWYQYAFTQMRAIPNYVRLSLFPFGQSLDHDFPISRTLTDHGAVFYGLVLLATVIGLILWRQRYPVTCFGLLMSLIWLAPTSSVIPIDDPFVERRMYLPLLGLILAGCELISRLSWSKGVLCSVLAFITLYFGWFTYSRNQLWGQPEKLVTLAATQASTNPRPMLNLTEILIRHNHCELAIPYLQRAERILGVSYYVDAAWGRVLACLNEDDQAMQRLSRAARLQPGAQVFEWLGLLYGKMGRLEEAGQILQKAVALDPQLESAHGSLALWYESVHDLVGAKREYQAAVSLDRGDLWAGLRLMRVEERLRR